MSDLEQKKKHRRVLRTMFTKNANELDSLLSASGERDEQATRCCKVSLELFQSKHDQLTIINAEILALMLESEASEDEIATEVENSEEYKRKHLDLQCRYESVFKCGAEKVSPARSVVNAETSLGNEGLERRRFKLPTITFKTFDGNVKNWMPFWAQFQKVHDDESIDANDKIEYLVQATVPGSRARQLVDSFPAVGKNYQKIIDSLTMRFGREDMQIEVSVRELLKLIINNSVSSQKMDLSLLYDRIETQLRALESLGITSNKCAAMLFPLIESCLPEELIRVWQRSSFGNAVVDSRTGSTENLDVGDSTLEVRLKNLMSFLRNEVENEQRISLATEGFGLQNVNICKSRSQLSDTRLKRKPEAGIPSATGLINCESTIKCVFCDGKHDSTKCFKARDMTLEQRRSTLAKKNACFNCLKIGHVSRRCRAKLRCIMCEKQHEAIMCSNRTEHKAKEDIKAVSSNQKATVGTSVTCTNNSGLKTHVFLQTLRVEVQGPNGSKSIRALIDTGSQYTYILMNTALELGYSSKRETKLIHCLFGGLTAEKSHHCYNVEVKNEAFRATFEALSQPVICMEVAPVSSGPWIKELNDLNILLSDRKGSGPIELLIGSDIAGKLYTGRRHETTCGLVAVETTLGWTLMGRVPELGDVWDTTTMTAISLFVKDASITNLWELDALGIKDPAEQKSEEDRAQNAKDFFNETLAIDDEGRYEVRLPWIDGHPPLPSNYAMAHKRLCNTYKKLSAEGLLNSYWLVFEQWLQEGIIERVSGSSGQEGHYLPHRPVIKEGSTTKIRPVFDASAREKGRPSLNQCLEKGLNLIEIIPEILLRFRKERLGVTADIKQAFLQISVHEKDRDFLRFLWMDQQGKIIIFRHRRVVFGVNSSPFLLGATIERHLLRILAACREKRAPYSEANVRLLLSSFYVDNCVASVSDENELDTFIQEAKKLMMEAKFDLRGWEYSGQVKQNFTHLLGLCWDTTEDVLRVNIEAIGDIPKLLKGPITKRLMLSLAQRVFDPIGFTCPATLLPKLLLQKTWEKKLGWDEPVEEEVASSFGSWVSELPLVNEIRIDRWIYAGGDDATERTLHTFCDASKDAYSAVVFLRGIRDGQVFVRLLAAKSRIAPIKQVTIPRLELLAAVVGARLHRTVKENLALDMKSFFWSDSSTVLSWIRREEEWATFVYNRVTEIRSVSARNEWHCVPGVKNPADMPSRGCSPRQLLDSKWWEGPDWLYNEPKNWPLSETSDFNETEVNREKKKGGATLLINVQSKDGSKEWHLTYFSKIKKTIRMIAWILRLKFNLRNKNSKRYGDIRLQEFEEARTFVFKIIQREAFFGERIKNIESLNCFKDEAGVIRLKSRVSRRDDSEQFRFPVILPAKHAVVRNLIFSEHLKAHVGTQGLICTLRENYWILGGRREIKSVISRCVVCRRHNIKPFGVDPPPLPESRVRDAAVFEVSGVDFAGPLFLKSGEKTWICLFTCAVYRAVHLELCSGLSVVNFMQALRRFIARRGRPRIIYSDNGTNFVGTYNTFSRLDWEKMAAGCATERIEWRFNPPTASWWGGFWERLVGVLKQILRKVLGRASLNYESLNTVLCDCEEVINSRPITYVSSDPEELIPLTPMMFLREQVNGEVPDCDAADQQSLCKKVVYLQGLRENLRLRFRSEYLGQLRILQNQRPNRKITIGEIILVGNDQEKRMDWPLGKVVELLPGKDGNVRLVRVKTARGQFLRPVQRIFPLECAAEEFQSSVPTQGESAEKDNVVSLEEDRETSVSRVSAREVKSRVPETKVVVTRSGRVSKLPQRYL